MCARNEDVLGRETTRLQRQERSQKPVKRHQKEKDEVRRFIGHHILSQGLRVSSSHQTLQPARSAYSAPIQTKVVAPRSSDLIFQWALLAASCSLSWSKESYKSQYIKRLRPHHNAHISLPPPFFLITSALCGRIQLNC